MRLRAAASRGSHPNYLLPAADVREERGRMTTVSRDCAVRSSAAEPTTGGPRLLSRRSSALPITSDLMGDRTEGDERPRFCASRQDSGSFFFFPSLYVPLGALSSSLLSPFDAYLR